MRGRKIYAGAKLRDLRQQFSLFQETFAAKLGVSMLYVYQMENNNWPVYSAVLLALEREFGFDISELSTCDSERHVSDIREALGREDAKLQPSPWEEARDFFIIAIIK